MTKAEIVQELLDKGYINAEKAVVLLTNEIQRGITALVITYYFFLNTNIGSYL